MKFKYVLLLSLLFSCEGTSFTTEAKAFYLLISVTLIFLIVLQIRLQYRIRQQMFEHRHAKQIDEAKLQFFINISHEIRTPISFILNPLKKLIATDDDSGRQKSYTGILRNTERILDLINQLMDVHKIDKEQMVLKFRQTEIVSFIADIYTLFEEQARDKQIELSYRPAVDELHAWIDTKHFDKILINVVSNALKYTQEGGKIEIILSNDEEGYYRIMITDSGVGINEDETGRIFERFYQTQQNNAGNQGAGIGLHLTRSLVELHHGNIKAENNPDGKGSRFIISLPLGKDHLAENEIGEDQGFISRQPAALPVISQTMPEDKTGKPKSKRCVLVVDDDEETRKYICGELAAECNTIECGNGKEALSIILKNKPDLVISDVMMPVMDGMTLCRRIRQNININHIPIILLTAKTKEEDNAEGLDIGADVYMTKPFNIEMLTKTALNLLRNRELLKNTFGNNQPQKSPVRKIIIKSPDEKLLEKVMKAINDNMNNPDLNVGMITNKIGISRVHLHRKLKELTGQSTRDLIRNTRLKQAATLLSNGHVKITEVAIATGFNNLSNFSCAFKELHGMSPREFMEQKKDD